MSINIGIDVGGTFTDFFAHSAAGAMYSCKVPTTHYDLSVGFMKGISQLAKILQQPLQEFLVQVESIRYSTTVGTNALIERSGPKLGLITTAGFEDTIFIGRARSWADGGTNEANRDLARIVKPKQLIEREMVVGLRERIDCFGNILAPLCREDVLENLQKLVDRGAQGFVVSCLWSFANPVHEKMVRQIIEEEYPESYLGAMPVVLSSEISPKAGEYTRTMTAIVNAYIHSIMAEELGKLGNELRGSGFKWPLTLVHNTGGTKKLSRTRAVLTHNAGPVAGLHGAATLGAQSNLSNIILTDMGGTSFDIGLVKAGQLRSDNFIPVIDRWRTNIPAVEIKSIGAGGGSIAWINEALGNTLAVGPRSAGSLPGPACYDQGGEEPTVTDADLVLGYYNPDNYLAGGLMLDVELAREVIEEKIALPLGIDSVEAAYSIRKLIDARMGQEVFNEVALKGEDPGKYSIYACGGAGASHACGYAPYIGVKQIIVPNYSAVFGAFGSSTMEIREIWERTQSMKIFEWATQSYSDDIELFNSTVDELRDKATRDLKLEGYQESDMRFQLELDMRFGSQYNLTRVPVAALVITEATQFKAICDQFTQLYSTIYSAEAIFPSGGINVECFYLHASIQRSPFSMPEETLLEPTPDSGARLETRPAYWGKQAGFVDTQTFDWSKLHPGNAVVGPAIIEAAETTVVIPPGWRYQMDCYRNGFLSTHEVS